MFTTLLKIDTGQARPNQKKPQEGDLFKVIAAHGKTFEIRYGFYEESDRHSRYVEPVEIYPNFIKYPQHTDDSQPFVTEMQPACAYFGGKKGADNDCGDCAFYERCEELIGICSCSANKNADFAGPPDVL